MAGGGNFTEERLPALSIPAERISEALPFHRCPNFPTDGDKQCRAFLFITNGAKLGCQYIYIYKV